MSEEAYNFRIELLSLRFSDLNFSIFNFSFFSHGSLYLFRYYKVVNYEKKSNLKWSKNTQMIGSAEEGENLRYSAYVYMYVAGGFKDPTTQFECNLERICIRQDES